MILMIFAFDCMYLGFQIKISESLSEEMKALVQCIGKSFILTVRLGTRGKGLRGSEGNSAAR
jgi:hypothetical protein